MSERSVKCPVCRFAFARLVDAGDFHAYVCACGWQRATTDRRPGNRPADVCGLCDMPVDLTTNDHHLYLGTRWVWGMGSRGEHIPVHMTCVEAGERPSFLQEVAAAWVAQRLGYDIDPVEVHARLRREQLERAS